MAEATAATSGWGLFLRLPRTQRSKNAASRVHSALQRGCFRDFVLAPPCPAEGTLCRVGDTRSWAPRARGTNRSNCETTCLGRLAMTFVAEQMDLVAAGRLRIVERLVGFREQFGDPPAMRAADDRGSDRGADLEAKTIPEQRPAQHRDSLLQHMRN